jgi:hypothetical protein
MANMAEPYGRTRRALLNKPGVLLSRNASRPSDDPVRRSHQGGVLGAVGFEGLACYSSASASRNASSSGSSIE